MHKRNEGFPHFHDLELYVKRLDPFMLSKTAHGIYSLVQHGRHSMKFLHIIMLVVKLLLNRIDEVRKRLKR